MTDNPFSVLGLTETATEEDIEQRFRELAQQHHPDHGGDTELMAKISVAYHAALESVRKRDLVPLAAVRELIVAVEKTNELVARQVETAEQAHKQRERSAEAERSVQRTIANRSSPYKRWKRAAAVLAVATGGIGLFGQDIIDALNALLPDDLPDNAGPLPSRVVEREMERRRLVATEPPLV